ncbi:PD-(D/E)XK nuclease family transposase [Methanobrevibacter cuticularis]|uniref:PD-(D/E)XK nuclease family transposase n=1 Tax=Methanobrevibacter cuticularis TaxID=47311 RepID=A0A166CRG3_9EURY|nr:Rpn family recombination-promoting nuclease/putative transposase [Methanobrevibacter cuticularis]KZX16267.1 PD-(D/E)XK nuclease family transposase [Methanobrevibacter cuticularis]
MRELDPLNDFAVLKCMGENGDEEQLLSFINAILENRNKIITENGIKNISVDEILDNIEINENTKLSAEKLKDKYCILDIRSKTSNKEIIIEAQRQNTGEMIKRSLFYACNIYRRLIKEGQNYQKLPEVIAINLIDYKMKNNDKVHTFYRLIDIPSIKTCTPKFLEGIEIHFINMQNFKKLKNKNINNFLHQWLIYFDKNTKPKLLEKVMKMNKTIEKAQKKLDLISMSDEDYRMYEMREMAQYDEITLKYTATQKGIEIGKEKASIEYAKKLKETGMSIEQISKIIDLPIEKIEKL